MSIRPFNGPFMLLLLLTAISIAVIRRLRKRPKKQRTGFLLILCIFNILFYSVYKCLLSVDQEFMLISQLEHFNWFNELPLQLCNVNLFLIPAGLLSQKRSILGFSFFTAPLGAAMALLFPESAFVGYSLMLPRIFGFYLTHILLIICGLSLSALGFYRPQRKDFPGIIAAFVILAFSAHLVNTLFRYTVCPQANYFFTYGADISLLNLFWKLIPIPFLYELPALLSLLCYMVIIEFFFCYTLNVSIYMNYCTIGRGNILF